MCITIHLAKASKCSKSSSCLANTQRSMLLDLEVNWTQKACNEPWLACKGKFLIFWSKLDFSNPNQKGVPYIVLVGQGELAHQNSLKKHNVKSIAMHLYVTKIDTLHGHATTHQITHFQLQTYPKNPMKSKIYPIQFESMK